MDVQVWRIERIKPYPKNARKIPQAAVDAVALSLREFGWQQPIVVDQAGLIIVGHVRRLAAIANGWTEAPVVLFQGTAAQARQYRLMDNRSHDEAKWDEDVLTAELLDMRGLELDLSLTGFSAGELDRLLGPTAGLTDPDDAPPVPIAPVSRLGDLWLCGPHRVLCGDATSVADTSRVLGGVPAPFLMVTDPPYGVDYNPTWREENSKKRAARGEREWFGYAKGAVENDGQCDWTAAWRCFPGDVAYVWHASLHGSEVMQSLLGAGFKPRAQLIWRKQAAVFGRGAYHWQHEPCWYAVRDGKRSQWVGDRKQSTVWDVQNLNPMGGNRDEETTGHSTQKPIEIMRRPIANHEGDVYDPFLGSGTTLIAAEMTGRICYGLEISPAYCDVIVQRWQNFTGKEATLDGHGATFAHVRDGRIMEVEDAIKEEVLEARP